MFFAALVFLPALAGLVAGGFTADRRVPWAQAAVCVVLGVTGAIASAFNPDGRTDNITFSIVASLVCGALVWGGYALGRLSRRAGSYA